MRERANSNTRDLHDVVYVRWDSLGDKLPPNILLLLLLPGDSRAGRKGRAERVVSSWAERALATTEPPPLRSLLHQVTEIRSYVAQGLTATADILAKRFEKEMKAGRLTRTPSAKVRGLALVDLMQGLQLRAKVGIARERLLQDARNYVPLILGKQI